MVGVHCAVCSLFNNLGDAAVGSSADMVPWVFIEYRNKTITRVFGGNTRYGCYFLAFMIFSFGILRDSL